MDIVETSLVTGRETLPNRSSLLRVLEQEDAEQASALHLEKDFDVPRRGIRRALLLLAALVLTFVGVSYALRARSGNTPRNVAGVMFAGTCEPSGEIRVSAENLGTVSEILVQPGDTVEKGQVILRMDDAEARASLQQTELDLAIAQQALSSIHSRYAEGTARLSVSQLEAQQLPTRQWRDSPERATAAYEHALTNYNRTSALFNAGVTAQQDLDDKAVELRLARDDLANAQKLAEASVRLQNNQREHASAESQISREEGLQALRQAELRVQESRRKVAATEIRAPKKAVVAEISAHVGERLSSGVLLARMADLHTMVVEVPVAAELISQLRINQPVSVQLPTLPARWVQGNIRVINPLPSANMTHTVKVEFSNSELSLLSGQPAKVRFLEP